MDLIDLPELKISKEERLKSEAEIREFVKDCRETVKRRVEKLKKAGYTDDEIEMIFTF